MVFCTRSSRPVSSPKESPVTENCDEPVALVVKNKANFTEPIIKGKENQSTSKSKTDNKDVVDDESFFFY